jgi:peptidoglycan/xylan/chitin deacetylase (PgdA/CDA1 family)
MNAEMIYPKRSFMSRVRDRLALLDRTHAVRLRLSTPVATFTFDDFPSSAYTKGGKILEEHGVRGTYFISGRFLNCMIEGIEYTTAEQLKLIYANGHEIGCHTFDHERLGSRPSSFARATCQKNSVLMSQIFGTSFKMSSFAYPYGHVSLHIKHVMSRQFGLCRGVRAGINNGTADLAQIRIVSLERYCWNSETVDKIISNARDRNVWLVFLSHDVSDSPSPYGSTPDQIRRPLHALKRAAIPVKTLKAAAAYGGL